MKIFIFWGILLIVLSGVIALTIFNIISYGLLALFLPIVVITRRSLVRIQLPLPSYPGFPLIIFVTSVSYQATTVNKRST